MSLFLNHGPLNGNADPITFKMASPLKCSATFDGFSKGVGIDPSLFADIVVVCIPLPGIPREKGVVDKLKTKNSPAVTSPRSVLARLQIKRYAKIKRRGHCLTGLDLIAARPKVVHTIHGWIDGRMATTAQLPPCQTTRVM